MLIKCRECGKEMSDQATSCPNCGCPVQPVNTGTPITPEEPKKKGSCLKTVLIIIGVLFLIFFVSAAIVGIMSDDTSDEPTPAKEEFTSELDYRGCLTHPDDHIGDKVVCEVYVYDATDSYCKANLSDDYSKDMFLHNKSDEKIIDGDTLRIYGIFNGNDATKNSLTGETGEIVALDVYYFDIIEDEEE